MNISATIGPVRPVERATCHEGPVVGCMFSRSLSSGLKTKNRYYNLESFSPKTQEGSPTMKFVRLTLSKLVKPPIEIPGAAMATCFAWVAAGIWALSPAPTQAQTGPFSPSKWPPTINTSATVDYVIIDPNAVFTTPAGWNANLILAGGGDQAYSGITLNGLFGDQSTSTYLNIADPNYTMFANVPVIDILVQVYGNSSLYNADGSGKGVGFLEGELNYLTSRAPAPCPWEPTTQSGTGCCSGDQRRRSRHGLSLCGRHLLPSTNRRPIWRSEWWNASPPRHWRWVDGPRHCIGPPRRVRNQQSSQCVHPRRHLRGGAAGQFDVC